MENSNLHLEIRKARINQGLSQKELGEMVGLPQQAINRIEQGQRKLDVELFEKLCKSLNIKKIGSFTVNFISSYYKMDVGDDPICHVDELEDDFPTDDPLSYENSSSFASSEEEFNKLQDKRQIELEKKNISNIHKYDASIEITPEAMERLKEDAEAREILKKYESGEKILDSEYKKVIEYHNRMMERSKLLQDWLEWYKNTCEPLNNEGRKKVAEYAETLAETDKYAKPKEWFQGRMTKEEIEKAVEAYLNNDTTDEPPQD